MPLLDLPNELQLEIFSQVTLDDRARSDVASLAKLCLTSKSIRALAETCLYRQIHLEFVTAYSDTRGERPHPPIHSFFRTICARPELAGYVKEMVLGHFDDRRRDAKPLPLRSIPWPPAAIFGSWIAAIQQLGVAAATKRKLEALIEQGDAVSLGAVLVFRLPNLESLSVGNMFARPPSHLNEIIMTSAMAVEPSSNFSFLEEFHIYNDGNTDSAHWPSLFEPEFYFQNYGETLDAFKARQKAHRVKMAFPYIDMTLSMWYIPKLKHASLILEPRGDRLLSGIDFSDIQPTFPNLKSLNVVDWGQNEALLTPLFSSMPNIQHISYFRAADMSELCALYDPGSLPPGYADEWNKFFDVLQHTASSLTSLTISIDVTMHRHYDRARQDSAHLSWQHTFFERMANAPIRPLTAFTKLRRLEVPIFVLLGWNLLEDMDNYQHSPLTYILPAGLEELCIRHDLSSCVDIKWVPSWNAANTPSELIAAVNSFSVLPQVLSRYIRGPNHNLKILRLKSPLDWLWPDAPVAELAEECKRRGVELIESIPDVRYPGNGQSDRKGRCRVEHNIVEVDADNKLVVQPLQRRTVTDELMGAFYHD